MCNVNSLVEVLSSNKFLSYKSLIFLLELGNPLSILKIMTNEEYLLILNNL